MQANNLLVNTAAVDGRLQVEHIDAQVKRVAWAASGKASIQTLEHYWLDLALTPRPPGLEANYANRWGNRRFVRPGDVLLVPPGETLHLRWQPARTDEVYQHISIVCRLSPVLIAECFEVPIQWTSQQLEAALNIAEETVHCTLKMAAREVLHRGFGSERMVTLLGNQMAIALGRYFAQLSNETFKGGLAMWRLRLIDERVNTLGKTPTLEELAELCRLSVRQLSRGFRVSRGCSVGSYIEQSRIENAKRLMINGEAIKSVAQRMGYASTSSFSQAFRRVAGITPAQFQKRV